MTLVRNDLTRTVTDTDTGEVIALERFQDEAFVRARMDAAIKKLATAWARAVTENYVVPALAAANLPTCAKSQTDPNA